MSQLAPMYAMLKQSGGERIELTPGARIQIKIPLPSRNEAIELTGCVTFRAASMSEEGAEFGVQFIGTTPRVRTRLAAEVVEQLRSHERMIRELSRE